MRGGVWEDGQALRHTASGESRPSRPARDSTENGDAGQSGQGARSHPACIQTKNKMTNGATLIEPLPTSLSGPDFESALVRRRGLSVKATIRARRECVWRLILRSLDWCVQTIQPPRVILFQALSHRSTQRRERGQNIAAKALRRRPPSTMCCPFRHIVQPACAPGSLTTEIPLSEARHAVLPTDDGAPAAVRRPDASGRGIPTSAAPDLVARWARQGPFEPLSSGARPPRHPDDRRVR